MSIVRSESIRNGKICGSKWILRRQGIKATAACALLGLAAANPALADEKAATVSLAPSLSLGTSAPISDEALGTESAKAAIQLDKLVVNEQDLDGEVTGNIAIGNQTGDNSVSGDAFTNAAGFVTVIQNTGNNVLIQNSTIVNVAVEP